MNFSPEDNIQARSEREPDSEVHRAVSEKIQQAISSILNQRIEDLIKQNVTQEDIELAANRLFSMADQGSTEENIEQELRKTSAKIATRVVAHSKGE